MLLLLMVAAVVVLAGCGGSSVSTSQVASAVGADGCTMSGFELVSRVDGSKDTIYDCTFTGPKSYGGSRERCITYTDGVANDSTAAVRLAFATAYGDRPACLNG